MTSAGGKEALSQMRRALKENDSFDFLIMNPEMPDLQKNRFIAQVRRMHPEAIYLVVFGPAPIPPWKGRTAGFDLFLRTPVRRDCLIQGMTSLIKGPRGEIKERTVEPPSMREHPYPKILLAEDNAVNRKLMTLMLEKAGYRVELAINGREVLDKVIGSGSAFDLIFMDVHMPEMDGIGATRIIREKGERSVPIIGITASTLEEDRQTCNEAGMNDYLIKPVALKQLIDVIERWSNHDQAYGL
jgi:CheY-like chemotaxis protein